MVCKLTGYLLALGAIVLDYPTRYFDFESSNPCGVYSSTVKYLNLKILLYAVGALYLICLLPYHQHPIQRSLWVSPGCLHKFPCYFLLMMAAASNNAVPVNPVLPVQESY